MPGDINSYGLELEITLQDQATPTLDSVNDRLMGIESQITNIATNVMAGFDASITALDTSLSSIAATFSEINDTVTLSVEPLRDTSMIGTEIEKGLIDEAALLKDKLLVDWLEITKILENKADLLMEEGDLLKEEEAQVGKIGRGFGFWHNQITRATNALKAHLASLLNIAGAIRESVAFSEQFVTANFRLYGSQTQLVNLANTLTSQYGILRGEAVLAIKALGEMRIPIESMNRLASSAAMFSRVSGVGIVQTAEWMKQLSAMGMSAMHVERRLEYMATAMRSFGLSADDVSFLMRTQQQQGAALSATFGSQVAGEIQRTQVALAAFGREMGATPEVARNLSAALGNIEFFRLDMIGQMAGVSAAEMRTAEGQSRAMAIALSRQAQAYRENADPAWRQSQLMMLQGIYGEQLGTAMHQMSEQMAANRDQAIDQASALELVNRTLNAQNEDVQGLSQIYAESNATIARQWDILKNRIFAAIGAIWARIEPAVILFLQWMNTMVEAIGWVVEVISGWLDALGPVGGVLKTIGAILITVAVAWFVLVKVLGMFGVASRAALGAGRAMGSVITSVLQGLARGLAALAPYTTVMLSLAALMLSVGLAALFLGYGVALIAREGWQGIAALTGLTIAIVALAIGLAFAGSMAMYAAPGLLALAVVLVAAGVAAILFAFAVKMIVSLGGAGVVTLILLAGAMMLLGYVMVSLAIMAMPVIPALLALSVAFIAVGVAALLLGIGLWFAVQALSMISVDMALRVLMFALIMIPAASLLIIAGVLLAVASVVLLVGAILLLAAALVAFVAAVIFIAASYIIWAGAFLLITGSLMLAIGAVLLIVGSVLLIIAAPILLVAALALIVPAVVLLIAAAILLPAALMIMIAGIFLLIGGIGVYVGALLLNLGAPLLDAAVWPLFWAGFWLLFAAPMLLAAGVVLAVAGIAILIGGLGVFLGGLFLFIGATLLFTGAFLLILASAFIFLAGILMILGVGPLLVGAAILIVASILLLVAAVIIIVPALLLAVAGIALLIAGLGIWLGGLMIRAGAALLVGGAWMLIEAAGPLMLAGLLLVPAGLLLAVGSIYLLIGSIFLLVAAIILIVAAAIFFVGALLFTLGIWMFEPGARLLIELAPGMLYASIMLMLAGVFILIAGVLLLVGGVLMIAASGVLIAAGIALYIASFFTDWGASALWDSAVMFAYIGPAFMRGGLGLYLGGLYMLMAVDILDRAGDLLDEVGPRVTASLRRLIAVAAISNLIAGPMQRLGMAVYYGGVYLYFGALWLEVAADALWDPAVNLWMSLTMLAEAVAQMDGVPIVEVGLRIAFGGRAIFEGAVWIAYAAYALLGPAYQILEAAYILYFGAMWLDAAATAMETPAWSLWVSLSIIGQALLELMAIPIVWIANQLMVGARMLLVAAIYISYAAAALYNPAYDILNAAQILYLGALWLQAAANAMYPAAWSMWSALILLGYALMELMAIPIVWIAEQLLLGAQGFLIAAIYITLAANALYAPAYSILQSAYVLYMAALWLDIAANAMRPPIYSIWISLTILRWALLNLMAVPIVWIANQVLVGAQLLFAAAGWIGAAAIALYGPALGILRSAQLLFFSAFWFDAAAAAMRAPAIILYQSLMLLAYGGLMFAFAMQRVGLALSRPLGLLLSAFASEAMSSAGELFDVLDLIVSRLETYGARMARQASQMGESLRGILPSSPVGFAGLFNALQAQPLTTVRTRDTAGEFREREEKNEQLTLQKRLLSEVQSLNTTMGQVKTSVDRVTGTGVTNVGRDVTRILDVLREYLPEMAQGGGGGLSVALNEWMR